MHETAALRLAGAAITDDQTEGSPLRFNRRRFERYPASGEAVAVVEHGGGRVVAGVELADSSATGLGFFSPSPAPLGERVEIYFNGQPLPGRAGVVRRCEAVTRVVGGRQMYRLGIDTGARRAA